MKNYKEITKDEVWPLLIKGAKIYAVIFEHETVSRGFELLWEWDVLEINRLLDSDIDNVGFYVYEPDEEE